MSANVKRKSKGKSKERILLLPGAMGWSAWKGVNGGGLSLALRTDERRALDVNGIPAGELAMAFPVRDVSSLPFRAPTDDPALFKDMADMHVERLGMRPGIDFGVLSDCFQVASRGEETLLQPVVLAPPPEGALPKRAPKIFDISARCLPLPDGAVLWRELGRWVFAVAEDGKPIHFQALASPRVGKEAGQEVRLALTQLQLQGLLEEVPETCLIWVEEEEAPPQPEEVAAFGDGFEGNTAVVAKPAPVIPPRPSHLLPADVRAERVAKRKRQQMIITVSSLVVLYLIAIGWGAWTVLKKNREVTDLREQVEARAPGLQEIKDLDAKWSEVEDVFHEDYWPVRMMLNVVNAIRGSSLRIAHVQLTNQVDEEGKLKREISVVGHAPDLGTVSEFSIELDRSSAFEGWVWNKPEAKKETNSDRWNFAYTAVFGASNE